MTRQLSLTLPQRWRPSSCLSPVLDIFIAAGTCGYCEYDCLVLVSDVKECVCFYFVTNVCSIVLQLAMDKMTHYLFIYFVSRHCLYWYLFCLEAGSDR